MTILPLESESLGGGGEGNGNPESKSLSNSHFTAHPATAPSIEAKAATASPEPQVVAAAEVETASESSIALISANIAPSESNADTTLASTNQITHGAAGLGGVGTGGNGLGSGTGSGSGSGPGSGSGSGPGGAGGGVTLTQARYRDTPRPEYPESARRRGREGRVLLRVLVDDQGRAKQVEINHSSGNAALDRAATEAIRRWRFYPARHGEKPIESWLRVPIEFRLDDAQTR